MSNFMEDNTMNANDEEPDVEGHIDGLQDPMQDKSAQNDEEPDVEAHIDGLQDPMQDPMQ